jgi:chromosome segregation ATPase
MPTKSPKPDRSSQLEQITAQMRPIERELTELAQAEQGLALQLSDIGQSVELVDTGDKSLLSQIAGEQQRSKIHQDTSADRANVAGQLAAIKALIAQKRQSLAGLQSKADRLQRDIEIDQEESTLKVAFDEYRNAAHHLNLAAAAFNRTAKNCSGAIERGGGFSGGFPPSARGIEIKHNHINLKTAPVSPETLGFLSENGTIETLAQV